MYRIFFSLKNNSFGGLGSSLAMYGAGGLAGGASGFAGAGLGSYG